MTKLLSGIYAIINLTNGRNYIGSTVHISRRWSVHRSYLARGDHQNSYLQRAWAKHGPDAFEFFVLELVEPERLIEIEQEWIDRLWEKGLYNRRRDAHSNLGVKHTEVSKAKMREIAKGRVFLPAAIAAQRIALAGRKHSDEEKERRASHHRGVKRSPKSIERMKASAAKRSKAHYAAIGAKRADNYLVTGPDGVERAVTNLRAFCREQGLWQGHLAAVVRGERDHHRGWRAIRIKDEPAGE